MRSEEATLMSMSLAALLAQARKRAFDQSAGGGLDTPSPVRTELPGTVYPNMPPGYYLLFCIHGKPMWEPCQSQTCRRTKSEARSNYERLCRGTL